MLPPPSDVAFPFVEPPRPFGLDTFEELERLFGDGLRRHGPIDPPPTRNPATPSVTADRVELRLYVSADSMNSARAVMALEQIVRAFPPRAFRTHVLDVATSVEAAARDRVLFTPTLILTDRAQRSTRVLGDLSKVDVLVELLRATGLEPV
jgi:hypothetical protein